MIEVTFNEKKMRLKRTGDKNLIFDVVRKKWVVITPEEWVRQNFLIFLIDVLRYPTALIGVEKKVVVGPLLQRCDIVVYRGNIPWMIIECKKMDVRLNKDALHQALRYHQSLRSKYIVITNGIETMGWEIRDSAAHAIVTMPDYSENH
jgi:hypothetical protein